MSDLREQFKASGFEIVDGGSVAGSLGVRKYGSCATLNRRPIACGCSRPALFQIRGLDCELEDKGYQKFWRHGETRFPIRKTDLQTLHRFDEEVRQILQLPSLYNESLGSTCAQTDYDRLEGRPDR